MVGKLLFLAYLMQFIGIWISSHTKCVPISSTCQFQTVKPECDGRRAESEIRKPPWARDIKINILPFAVPEQTRAVLLLLSHFRIARKERDGGERSLIESRRRGWGGEEGGNWTDNKKAPVALCLYALLGKAPYRIMLSPCRKACNNWKYSVKRNFSGLDSS